MDIQFGQIIADLITHIINFIVIFVVVRTLLYKPVLEFLQKRQARVKAELDNSKKNNLEAEQYRIEYQKKLEDAKEEAAAMAKASENRASEAYDEIIKQAHEEASEIIAQAKMQAKAERDASIEKLRNEFSQLSVQLASKILQREVSMKDNQGIIDEFFEKVG